MKPGSFYCNTDTLGCIQRIKQASIMDLDQLRLAFWQEEDKKHPRKKLMRHLRLRIQELQSR